MKFHTKHERLTLRYGISQIMQLSARAMRNLNQWNGDERVDSWHRSCNELLGRQDTDLLLQLKNIETGRIRGGLKQGHS